MAVPSATMTMPAWMDRPMPTPPPWWTETQEAPLDRVEEGVEDRPVGDRVRAVPHALGLAVRRGDRAGVEVVPADDDGRGDLALLDQVVDDGAEAGPLAVAEPADAGRQALELDLGPGLADPAGQGLVLGELLEDGLVRGVDVLRFAGERRPAEGPLAEAEQRPDVFGDEARDVEGRRPLPLSGPGRGCCCRSRTTWRRASGARAWPRRGRPWPRRTAGCSRPGPSPGGPARPRRRSPFGHVAVELVVGRGLVGQDVGRDAAPDELRAGRRRRCRGGRSTAARPSSWPPRPGAGPRPGCRS